jgi:hypothetical protein
VTYAHIVDVAAPIEMYDALHADILRRGGHAADGLLVHVGRPTASGFQVLEIWESRSHFEHYNDQIVLPGLERMTAPRPGPSPQQTIQEFDVHGLVLTGAKQVI